VVIIQDNKVQKQNSAMKIISFFTICFLRINSAPAYVSTTVKNINRLLPNFGVTPYNDPLPPPITAAPSKKISLSWCAGIGLSDEEECRIDSLREVVKNEKEIVFQSPATGQVIFEHNCNDPLICPRSVLLLLREGDQSLIDFVLERRTPSDGTPNYKNVNFIETLANSNVNVYLEEKVFNVVMKEMSAPLSSMIHKYIPCVPVFEPPPDLVVTLGGDGLLMHANSLFPHAVPPVLSVAGGSLGFLTPFARQNFLEDVFFSLGIRMPDVSSDALFISPRVPISLRMRLSAHIGERAKRASTSTSADRSESSRVEARRGEN